MKKVYEATPDPIVAAEAEAKRKRNKRYPWCRLWNDFLDDPKLRVVSRMTGLPLFAVQAFATKLESLANHAVERGEARGYVGDFKAVEFSVAMDLPIDQVETIFAALHHTDSGPWVDQDHVTLFWNRNRDRADATVNERQDRRRARKRVREELEKRLNAESIAQEQFDTVVVLLPVLSDPELFRLKDKLVSGVALEAALSTCHAGHSVTIRDIVTVTPRAEHSRTDHTGVQNNGQSAAGEAVKASEEEERRRESLSTGHNVTCEQWISSDGVLLVVERLQVVRTRAETLIERWRRYLNDAEAFKTILEDAAIQTTSPSRFLVMVTNQVERHRDSAANGPRLALGPTALATLRKVGNG